MGCTTSCRTVSWLRQLVACLSPWRTRFNARPVHVEFFVDKVTLRQVSLQIFWLSPVSIISFLQFIKGHDRWNCAVTTLTWWRRIDQALKVTVVGLYPFHHVWWGNTTSYHIQRLTDAWIFQSYCWELQGYCTPFLPVHCPIFRQRVFLISVITCAHFKSLKTCIIATELYLASNKLGHLSLKFAIIVEDLRFFIWQEYFLTESLSREV